MSAGAVVVYFSRLGGFMYTHERVVLSAVAEAIAEIKHCEFAARFDDAERHAGSVFFVPDDTLIADEAAYLGIRGPNDLYGGVVPYPFAKTKAITHQLIDACADRPERWSSVFPEKVKDVVLPGYTVFNLDDARVAARRLRDLGPIRIKEPLAAGGKGQAVAATIEQVNTFLETFDAAEIAVHGLVLESNLRDVTTVSIGQITIDDMTIAYHGKQRVAINNEGSPTYGGSNLVCVRGGWKALAELPMPSPPPRRNSTMPRRASTQALPSRGGIMMSLRASTDKADCDQAFWKHRGGQEVPAPLNSQPSKSSHRTLHCRSSKHAP